MTTLGLFLDGFHDSNVAISDDQGYIEKAAAEERFSRTIQDGGAPNLSYQWIKKQSGTATQVVIPGQSLEESSRILSDFGRSTELANALFNKRERKLKELDADRLDRQYIPHLLAHAASAFFCSNFDEAYVLVADGGNVWEPWTVALYHGDGNQLRCINLGDDELTDLYMFATALLGFKPNRHEGKLTGLAAHQDENLSLRLKFQELRHRYKISGQTLASQYLRWKDIETTPLLNVDNEVIKNISRSFPSCTREQVAYEAQFITEQEVIGYLKTHLPNFNLPICTSGGLFANIKLNKTILDMGFPRIYIHPAMGDAGLSVGSLAYVNSLEGKRFFLDNVFLGPSYTDYEIKLALNKYQLDYHVETNVEKFIAQCFAEGKLVGRMSGNLEYGPRALGNRSILCSAQNKEQIERLNNNLRRDEFMPFAPAILAEHFDECVTNSEAMREPSLWMTIACDATSTFINYVPALVHVDNTIRPQCVSKELFPEFHSVIEEYYDMTGIPTILNTSFNMHGEPIVCSPDHAISTFLRAKLDVLVIQNYVIIRK
jgi:carbamoyltransferase